MSLLIKWSAILFVMHGFLLSPVLAKSYESLTINQLTAIANKGDALAQSKLGKMYYQGKSDVGFDYSAALKWFTKAADQGDAYSQMNLGVMHYFGDGVKKDKEVARKWYLKAAEQGDISAQYNLGNIFDTGDGVVEDNKAAVKWFTKVAEQQYNESSPKLFYSLVEGAQYYLGMIYYKGSKDVEQDYGLAAKWITKAAKLGGSQAQKDLALLYYQGEGVKRNRKLAADWMLKAAIQGNADAQYNLGSFYYNGEGVGVDIMESIRWLKKAASLGHDGAAALVKNIEVPVGKQ